MIASQHSLVELLIVKSLKQRWNPGSHNALKQKHLQFFKRSKQQLAQFFLWKTLRKILITSHVKQSSQSKALRCKASLLDYPLLLVQ